MTVEYMDFVRKPFTVEAVEVTRENIKELAKDIGILKKKEDGTPFIQVNHRLVPNVFRVFPGYWVTRMGDNVRCYSRKIFFEQFIQNTDEINAFVVWINTEDEVDEPELTEPATA